MRRIELDGQPAAGHPLLGARVELLDVPRFGGRNWIVASDGAEPIDPLHLRVARGGVVLDKRDVLTGSDGTERPLYPTPADAPSSPHPAVRG